VTGKVGSGNTRVEGDINLPLVRQLEAVSFRAWPSTITQYDGAWVLRLSGGLPTRRINSVSVLDPADNKQLETRIGRAEARYRSFGRPLIFRQTPLMPQRLVDRLDENGWDRQSESLVMTADIASIDLSAAPEQLAFKEVGHWVDQFLALQNRDKSQKPGLSELINFIEPQKGLFLAEADEANAIATALSVRDGKLAGLFEIAVAEAKRGQGHGRRIVLAALRWAKMNSAKTAWLQVEVDNEPALSLYRSLGFEEQYRYQYRIKTEDVA
jgi:ribosomal protein S18 acetylase RimI-like enzyme